MTNKKKQNRKGTALITAIMLCAIFAAAIVGVGSFAIRQINITKAYSDGLVAYYAAESGIEEGLLRYRYNKNAQVPKNIGPYTSDALKRTPINGYRNYLNLAVSRGDILNSGGDYGLHLGYNGNDLQPVYDLQVFYQQKYLGQDINADGKVDAGDLRDPNYQNNTAYKIIKDDSKSFTIPNDQGDLSLYWRWLAACTPTSKHALDVKLRVSEADAASGKNTYTALFRDENCPITNSSPADLNPGPPIVYSVANLKGRMNITSKTITELTLHPVGQTAADDAGLVFGYSQFAGNAQVAGLTTTVRSIGYFRGTTREIKAEIDRQSGTILDLFNYVLYKGGS